VSGELRPARGETRQRNGLPWERTTAALGQALSARRGFIPANRLLDDAARPTNVSATLGDRDTDMWARLNSSFLILNIPEISFLEREKIDRQ
jgi:hypothetical protein